MRYEVIVCDDCNRGNDDGITVSEYKIYRGKEADPSGNGYTHNFEYVDFCKECLEIHKKKNPDDEITFTKSGKPA
jgi:hypothetical protein